MVFSLVHILAALSTLLVIHALKVDEEQVSSDAVSLDATNDCDNFCYADPSFCTNLQTKDKREHCPKCNDVCFTICTADPSSCTDAGTKDLCKNCHSCQLPHETHEVALQDDIHEAALHRRCSDGMKAWEAAHPRMKIRRAGDDGNCFYYSLAHFTMPDDCDGAGFCPAAARYLRQLLAKYLLANEHLFVEVAKAGCDIGKTGYAQCVDNKNTEYIKTVLEDKQMATNVEINAAGLMLGVKFHIVSFGEDGSSEPYELFEGDDQRFSTMHTLVYCAKHWMPVDNV